MRYYCVGTDYNHPEPNIYLWTNVTLDGHIVPTSNLICARIYPSYADAAQALSEIPPDFSKNVKMSVLEIVAVAVQPAQPDITNGERRIDLEL